MAEIGYALSSEEHAPNDLVRNARLAEEAGFPFALISDHFHPWIDAQGHSPFVWSVIGGIAGATERLRLGTGVTCPTIRIHPAIIAQAAATAGAMMPGRFFLGVGTGENLNEHILGDKWPESEVRRDMLAESIELIRLLWQGETASWDGDWYTVENARIYDVPDPLPDIYVAASGPAAAELAGNIGDGFIGTSPEAETLKTFDDSGGAGKPKYGQASVCWAPTEEEGVRTVKEIWPTAGVPGELSQELPSPKHFEQVSKLVTEDALKESVVCGPDAQRHIELIQEYIDAGYTHVYLHQIGPDQEGFFDFYRREVLPHFADAARDATAARR